MRKRLLITPLSCRLIAVSLVLTLAAGCSGSGDSKDGIRDKPGPAFSAISQGETIYFLGTEPFWGGETTDDKLRYTVPDDPDGTQIAVKRFNGNNGMALSGELDSAPFRMVITPGRCSDGMSDAQFPYTVTLKIGDETRFGCAWTDRELRIGGEG